jgi:hypothetical protein
VTEAAAPSPAEGVCLRTSYDTHYSWSYATTREGLHDLYEKAKREQWNATTELAWDTPVEPESEIIPAAYNPFQEYRPFRQLEARQAARLRHASVAWQLSQFMHGEQGALMTASQLVGAVPWIDAKYYAASQTLDEARHVEVFSRYLRQKLEWEWPVNPNLKHLLDLILQDARWDFKYLGMQILVEGLAMAAFANLYQLAQEPLLKAVVHNVMRDEARHVAFGMLSLRGFYDDMPEAERRDREEFVIEACRLMRDRLVGEEVADAVGFDREEVRRILLDSPILQMFRRALFARVVPNVKRLGLLSRRVRAAFEEMRILEFEDADPEALDRAIGLA